VLARRRGLFGRVARLGDDPALQGIAGFVSAGEDGARVHLASMLTPTATALARPESFTPALLDSISGDAIAYFGARGVDRIYERVSSLVGGTSLPLPAPLRDFVRDIERSGGPRALRGLDPLLTEEAALFLSRSGAVPVVTVVVNDIDDAEADRVLARLQPLLARLVQRPAATGQVPTFRPLQVAGINAASLRVTPSLELTYAIFDGRAVVSTSPGGIRRVKLARSRLLDNDLFAPGMRGRFDGASSLLFLDLEQLLALGEQAGLGEAAGFQALESDLAAVRAVSAVTRRRAATRTAEIFIEVP
jgi:hypothetical protein